MKVSVVQIGNSRSIRPPKAVLEQCGFDKTVEMTVERGRVVLAASDRVRAGWAAAFAAADTSPDAEDREWIQAGRGEAWDDWVPKRFEVWVVRLDRTVGSEIGKARPAVIVSPDDANEALRTVVVAPLRSTLRNRPTRVQVRVRRKTGEVALDQLRTVDKSRLTRRTATLTSAEAKDVSDRLVEMFKL